MSSKRFTGDQRLRKPSQFKAVFAEGQRIRGTAFTVVMRPNGGEHPRLGLAIAKRQIKRAVDRNRLKRAIRERLRLTQDTLPPLDLVFLANAPAAKLSRADLSGAVADSLNLARRRGTKA